MSSGESIFVEGEGERSTCRIDGVERRSPIGVERRCLSSCTLSVLPGIVLSRGFVRE